MPHVVFSDEYLDSSTFIIDHWDLHYIMVTQEMWGDERPEARINWHLRGVIGSAIVLKQVFNHLRRQANA